MTKSPVLVNSDPVITALRSRRGWLLVGLGAAVGAIAGMVWLFATPKTYEATIALELTSVAPQVNINSVGARPDPVTIDTDAQIVMSDAVVDAVARTSSRDRTDVRNSLGVSARPLTRVMNIVYSADSATEAIQGASKAADAFLSEKERLIVEPVRSYLQSVESQDAQVSSAGGSLRQSTPDLWELEARSQSAMAAELRLQGAGEILEGARITAAGERGDVEVPVVTGIALGALLGLVGAVMLAAGRTSGPARASVLS